MSSTTVRSQLIRNRHAAFFMHFLKLSPSSLSEYDNTRLTYAFFAIAGLDVLQLLDQLTPQFRSQLISWIYGLVVEPRNESNYGFQGGSSNFIRGTSSDHSYENAHLAMTYSAIVSLVTLGDDLERLNKDFVIKTLKALQQPDGSFCGSKGEEADMRFVFCAASISYMLNDFTGIDLDLMFSFIRKSINYDGGIGQGPGLESHGGSTFCAIAALHLTSLLHLLTPKESEGIKRWCLMRQKDGFQGRPYKLPDTCYSFWVGGTLKILDCFSWVNFSENRKFVMSTQDSDRGGFSKYPFGNSDPLHAFFGLCGLSLMEEEELAPIEPSLCITKRAFRQLQSLRSKWVQ